MREIEKNKKVNICDYLLNNHIDNLNELFKEQNIYVFKNNELLNFYKILRKELYKRGVFK